MSDRYRIIKKIGQGGAGAVYLADDTSLGRRVALKKLKPVSEAEHSNDSPDTSSSVPHSLFQEAKALSALQHPNIVTVFDIVEDPDGSFVVMEFLSGETLEATVRNAPLPLADFFKVGIESLEALSAAHRQGILHRDIKPGNLMLVWDDSGHYRVKILDFGLAKFTKEPALQTMDHSGSILGTIHFMAPEQFERGLLDQRTDLYSLGCVLYQTLTQRYPFDGETGPEVMAAHLQHRRDPLDALRHDLPAEVLSWMNRMMARDSDDRFSGSEEALKELKSIHSRFLDGSLTIAESAEPKSIAASETPAAEPKQTKNDPKQDPSIDQVLLPTVRLKPPVHSTKQPRKAGVVWTVSMGILVLSGLAFLFAQGLSPDQKSEQTAPIEDLSTPETEAVLSPFIVEEISQNKRQKIIVEGTIKHVGESNSGKTRYLNFSWPPGDSVPLAISITPGNQSEFSMSRLNEISGKTIRAKGEVESVFGNLQVKLLSWSDLEVLP